MFCLRLTERRRTAVKIGILGTGKPALRAGSIALRFKYADTRLY
jgi:hypothetical protein